MNEQLAAIRARREAVTPGVWWVDKLQWQCVVSAPNRVIASTHPYSVVHDDEPNAAFIAAAPADIDTLLAEVERLTVALHDDAATKLGDAVLEASRLRREVAALTAERDALAQQLQQAQTQLAAWSVKPNAQYIAIAQQRVEQATTPEA